MANQPDAANATQSSPWFMAQQNTQGLSITTQRSALNEQVNGVAQDLTTQNTQLTTSLAAIVTALNNLPSA